MATIAISPVQEPGHVLPTLQMAKALRARGHRVVYVGLEDTRALIQAEGFTHVTLCADELPAGALAAMRARARGHRIGTLARAIESGWRERAAARLLAGHEDDQLAGIGAELAVCDADWEEPRLAFGALGVPTMTVAANLWGGYPGARLRDYLADEVPPMSSLRAPGGSPVRDALDWSRHGAHELADLALRELSFARAAGDVWSRSRARRRALRRDVRAGPRLVLCPEELDFPRRGARPPALHYTGPCIDLSRREPDDPDAPELASPPAGRPLVYCAVGSQGHRVTDDRFLRAVIAAAGEWQLVVSTGGVDPRSLGEVPENVVVRAHVPQLHILARAQAAIVHGGLGTIKECVWFGVPMLVLPGHHDQPGNAARVAYHGLGLARPRAGTDAALIRTLVTRLIAEPDRRARLAGWAERFREQERAARHVAVIEAELR